MKTGILTALVLICALLLLSGCLNKQPAEGALPTASNDFVYEAVRPSQRAPDFTLTDQYGQTVSLSDFGEETVVLAFWYVNCTHSCKIGAYTIATLPGLLASHLPEGADRINCLAVTLDPEIDTAAQRKTFVDTFVTPYGGNLLFLGGGRDQVAPIWDDYEVFVEKQSLSQLLQLLRLTEADLLKETDKDLETAFHAALPEAVKQGVKDGLHVAIEDDYYISHVDVIYVIKHGDPKFKILGHDIDPVKFAELLNYVATHK